MPLRHIIDLGWWIYRMINFTAKKGSPSCFTTAWNYKPYNMDTYPAFLWFKIRSMDWWYKDEHAGLKVTELMSVGWVSHLLFVHSVVLFFGFPLFFLSHWERRSAWGLEEAPTSATCPPRLYQPTWPESHFHLQESGIKKDKHKPSYKPWTALIALSPLHTDDKSDSHCIAKSRMSHTVELAACLKLCCA